MPNNFLYFFWNVVFQFIVVVLQLFYQEIGPQDIPILHNEVTHGA
jgi:hypothetical protein